VGVDLFALVGAGAVDGLQRALTAGTVPASQGHSKVQSKSQQAAHHSGAAGSIVALAQRDGQGRQLLHVAAISGTVLIDESTRSRPLTR
jgi:hypothetical protein